MTNKGVSSAKGFLKPFFLFQPSGGDIKPPFHGGIDPLSFPALIAPEYVSSAAKDPEQTATKQNVQKTLERDLGTRNTRRKC
jgi:hypothetical protein